MLELKSVTSGYVEEVIKDVTLKAERGEFIGILGPNGSGKTTLLRTIAGYLKARRGRVVLNGKDIRDMSVREIARVLAVVPQIPEGNLDFRVEDVVMMGRNPYIGRFEVEGDEDYRIAAEAMRRAGCLNLVGRRLRELSGGEVQKVMIARALAQEPSVLLLDEPTSHLDVNHQIEVMEMLRRLADSGTLVIAVIHDVNLALQFCTKILVMKDGKVLAYGRPEEVIGAIPEAFGVEFIVRRNPVTGRYYVIPFKPKTCGGRVHVICGGGTGAGVMVRIGRGSAGVLNVLDTDWEIANGLGFDVVSEAPFSPISDEAHEENVKMIERSDFVILTDVPFGMGNLRNLEAALYASDQGKLLIIEKTPIERRDYTGGRAAEIYRRLKGKIFRSEEDLISEVFQTM